MSCAADDVSGAACAGLPVIDAMTRRGKSARLIELPNEFPNAMNAVHPCPNEITPQANSQIIV